MKSLFAALLLVGSSVAGNPLSVELISEVKALAPGETFTVGLHLTPPAGYHTYWKHSGIVGLATSIEWDLPPGFSAGEIQWPAPQTVKMARYTAQGYREEALLMVPITPPENISGSSIILKARGSWMCCGDQCHPASNIPFLITLPVAKSAVKDPATTPLFDLSRGKVPRKDDAWKVEVLRKPGTIVLTLTSRQPDLTRDVADLGGLRFFTTDGQVASNGDQKVTRGPGQQIHIELPISKQSAGSEPPGSPPLAGVITADHSWRKDGISTALELP